MPTISWQVVPPGGFSLELGCPSRQVLPPDRLPLVAGRLNPGAAKAGYPLFPLLTPMQMMSTDWDLELCHWLTLPDARAGAEFLSMQGGASPANIARLRKSHAPAQVAALLDLHAIEHKGAEKFPGPPLLFSPKALEQATDQAVADYKAGRIFAARPAGLLVDVGCGLGGDLLANARLRDALGIERHAGLARLAEYNLAVRGLSSQGRVLTGDALAFDLAKASVWHVDPDRRPQGNRGIRLEDSEPPLEALLKRLDILPHAAWKLAPACQLSDSLQAVVTQTATREWISRGGECRQQVLWWGELASQPGRCQATKLDAVGKVLGTCYWTPPPEQISVPLADTCEAFLVEPDPAVLAGGGAEALAAELALSKLTAGGGYLTSKEPVQHPLLQSYEVQVVLPARLEKVATWLKQRSAGSVQVKKRGVDLDPHAWQRQLQGTGTNPFWLAAYRHGSKSVVAILKKC